MDTQVLTGIAEELDRAKQSRSPIEPLTDRYSDLTVADAYQIQQANVARELGTGRVSIGKKIGLTSSGMQQMLGVNEPDYGCLLDDMLADIEAPIALSRLIQPRIEAEIAFILSKPLHGPGVTVSRVLQATEGVMAAFEIIDSRVQGWKIKLVDTVADNASSAMLALSSTLAGTRHLDLQTVGMVFEQNGKIIATAAAAEVLGHPATAVAWLANKLAEYGASLEAGDIVLSGALTKAVPIAPNDSFRATFGGIGSVKARFTA